MATYGGGTVFSGTNSFVNVNANSVVAAIGSPGANAYTEFQTLSATVVTAGASTMVTLDFLIQSDNGIGGWVNTTSISSVSLNDAPVNNTIAFPGQQVWKIFPGQRVIAISTGGVGSVIRFSFSTLTYTPST